jgi:hypothetical protein
MKGVNMVSKEMKEEKEKRIAEHREKEKQHLQQVFKNGLMLFLNSYARIMNPKGTRLLRALSKPLVPSGAFLKAENMRLRWSLIIFPNY